MKLRYLVSLPLVAFLISLLVSTNIAQSQTQILAETRKSALIAYVTHSKQYSDSPWTVSDKLLVLTMLDALDAVNVTHELDLVLSEESIVVGNETLWGWPYQRFANIAENSPYITDLCEIWDILSALKLFDALDRVNRTALIDIVMLRYNVSDGFFMNP